MRWTIRLFFFIATTVPTLLYGQRSIYFYHDLPIVPSVEIAYENDSISVEDILLKQKLAYQDVSLLPGTAPDVPHWLRFDLQPYLHLFHTYDTLYLDTFSFERAWVFKSDTSGFEITYIDFFEDKSFKSNSISRSFIPIAKTALLKGRYVIIKTMLVFDRSWGLNTRYYLNTNDKKIVQNNFTFQN